VLPFLARPSVAGRDFASLLYPNLASLAGPLRRSTPAALAASRARASRRKAGDSAVSAAC
jgi:hypothetical protein